MSPFRFEKAAEYPQTEADCRAAERVLVKRDQDCAQSDLNCSDCHRHLDTSVAVTLVGEGLTAEPRPTLRGQVSGSLHIRLR